MSRLVFPNDFIWGTATSAYQIEGGHNCDGKGESIWDRFSHIPGKIFNDDTGDIACDHYHLFREDVKLLKAMGVKSYRFSISWTRIFPDGTGRPNRKGIDFYRKLAELLVDNGIIPAVTLYHWDLPQKLQDLGGWTTWTMAAYFEQYASLLFKELGDIVPIWTTFNEPWVSAFVGYWYGGHPPGTKDLSKALLASHHMMLAHGMAVRAFKELGNKGEIGITLNLNPVYPASADKKDLDAAGRYGDFLNGWFLDPILKGHYPVKLLEWLTDKVEFPEFLDSDMDIINTPLDFLGINTYSSSSIYHDSEKGLLQLAFANTGKPRTDSGWEIYPEGLYDLLLYLHKEYNGIKMFITENGAAFKDIVDGEGNVADDDRIQYLHDHILQAYQALEAGVNLAGYYVWSFMDNFEWNAGYSKRFGLVYIDFKTQQRITKKSGLWYKGVIADNGINAQ
jgi:beta-glucosidase